MNGNLKFIHVTSFVKIASLQSFSEIECSYYFSCLQNSSGLFITRAVYWVIVQSIHNCPVYSDQMFQVIEIIIHIFPLEDNDCLCVLVTRCIGIFIFVHTPDDETNM